MRGKSPSINYSHQLFKTIEVWIFFFLSGIPLFDVRIVKAFINGLENRTLLLSSTLFL